MLPNCFIIGAAKCGTTSLHDYLGRHPEIFMSPVKEPNFFTQGGIDQDWYEELFAGAGDARVRGEATPNYSKATEFPETPAKIAALVPDAKLIYLVRDPIERIRSQYEHALTPPANDFRDQERRRFSVAIRDDHRYVDGSRYAMQIERYLDHFERGRLLVLSSERLRTDRSRVLRKTFAFLGVEPDFWVPEYSRELHRSDQREITSRRGAELVAGLQGSAWRRVLPTGARSWLKRRLRSPRARPNVTVESADAAWLWEQLEPDVRRLRDYVGPDFDLWGRA